MKLVDRFLIETYNVGIIKKSLDQVMEAGVNTGEIQWLKHNYRDRFFADPFLINSDENFYYILCEEFLFFEEKGKITLLTIKKDGFELENRRVIIEEPYHLSFPYCKYNGNEIIPEACQSESSYKYTINPDTYEVLNKEKILDEGAIDATIYENVDGNYLYATRQPNPLTETLVYESDGKGGYITPGKIVLKNDLKHARAAGDFFSWRGQLYRAVQDCYGRYGRQTKIMKISGLGVNYKAEEVATINSFKNPPFNQTMHTFNVYNDAIIVDGSRDYLRFPMKIFYKKARFLFAKRLTK